MESAMAVANKIIEMGIQKGMPVTQMKLQKLLFYAQGWHYPAFNCPLFDDNFEAWDYGPVIPRIYREFKSFGIDGINRKGMELVPCGKGYVIAEPQLSRKEELEPFFEKIWEVYGIYSGTQLSKRTHEPDTPWSIVRAPYGENIPKEIPIPKDLIKQYFYGMYEHNMRALEGGA